jgi:hypothetical protein
MSRNFLFILIAVSSLILNSGLTAHKREDSISYIDKSLRPEITTLNVVWEMIRQVSQERVLNNLSLLTGDDSICTSQGCYNVIGRETGSEGLQWAKDYVRETLAGLDYSVEVMDWTRDGYADQNIIARKQGRISPAEEIYLVAHLDGYLDNNPAADDDASGVVSLLELARILSSRNLARTLVLFFSTGEEHGSLGSRSYVDQLDPKQLKAIKYLLNVEMLSYDSNNDGKMELWSGDEQDDFMNQLVHIIAAYNIALEPELFTDCY